MPGQTDGIVSVLIIYIIEYFPQAPNKSIAIGFNIQHLIECFLSLRDFVLSHTGL